MLVAQLRCGGYMKPLLALVAQLPYQLVQALLRRQDHHDVSLLRSKEKAARITAHGAAFNIDTPPALLHRERLRLRSLLRLRV